MAYQYITTATTTQVDNGPINEAVIMVNTALTGTITIVDGISGTTANVAVITNPTVGSMYRYYTLKTGLRIVTSAICDITAMTKPK